MAVGTLICSRASQARAATHWATPCQPQGLGLAGTGLLGRAWGLGVGRGYAPNGRAPPAYIGLYYVPLFRRSGLRTFGLKKRLI